MTATAWIIYPDGSIDRNGPSVTVIGPANVDWRAVCPGHQPGDPETEVVIDLTSAVLAERGQRYAGRAVTARASLVGGPADTPLLLGGVAGGYYGASKPRAARAAEVRELLARLQGERADLARIIELAQALRPDADPAAVAEWCQRRRRALGITTGDEIDPVTGYPHPAGRLLDRYTGCLVEPDDIRL